MDVVHPTTSEVDNAKGNVEETLRNLCACGQALIMIK